MINSTSVPVEYKLTGFSSYEDAKRFATEAQAKITQTLNAGEERVAEGLLNTVSVLPEANGQQAGFKVVFSHPSQDITQMIHDLIALRSADPEAPSTLSLQVITQPVAAVEIPISFT